MKNVYNSQTIITQNGPTGSVGVAGPVGPQGMQGPQGEIGPQGPSAISSCSDVNLNSLSTGDILRYNNSNTRWENINVLDGSDKIRLSYIPDSLIGAVIYQGVWNASTNTPNLNIIGPEKGHYYVVSVAGNTNLNGISTWEFRDVAIYNGVQWDRLNATDNITSVFGRTGSITAQEGDYNLNLLGDVNINSPTNNQILSYNGTNWTNINRSAGAYEIVYNFIPGFTVSAENNKFYLLGAGGTVNVDNMQPGERFMVSSNANPITIQFGASYFVLNSNFSGGTAGVTCNLTACTVEFYCSDSFGSQRYFHITRVSQNRNNSVFTINGQKYSALNSVNNIPDVSISSPSNGQTLVYNSGVWENQTPSGGSLGSLSDVSIASLVPFSILAYDGTVWRNFPYSESVTSVHGRLGNVVSAFGDYTINQISGISPLASAGVVSLTSPSNGQVLRFNGTQWVNATNILSFSGRTGAVIPQSADYNIAQISNASVLANSGNIAISSPTNGQVLTFNGVQWTNATPVSSPVTSFNSRTGAILPASGDYNINQLAGVSISSPSTNQQLIYNGTNWVNGSATSGVSSFNSRTGHVVPTTNDYTIAQIQNSSFIATTANVNISIPQNNESLIWDAPSQRFVNRLIPQSFFICYNSAVNLSNGLFFRNTGTGTLAQAAYIIPRQCRLRGITGWVNVTNGAGVGWTYTVTRNGVDVGLAVSMLGTLGANSASADINFNQFEFIQVRINSVGAPVTSTGGCSIEFV
jgi:hypothetical protein